jgi:PAS domain S-box-containing protein
MIRRRAQASIVRTVGAIAKGVAAIVTITLPLGYFVMSYGHQAGVLSAEAAFTALSLSQVVNTNPDLWHLQETRLQEILGQRVTRGASERRRILGTGNRLITEAGGTVPWPVLSRTADVFDAGVPIGRVEIGWSLRPLLHQTGAVAGFGLMLGVIVFVTLRMLPLRALARSEHRLRSVTDSAPDAIVLTDRDDRILSWNRGAETIFGHAEGEVLGTPLGDLFTEDSRRAYRRLLANPATSDRGSRSATATIELTGLTKASGEVPLELGLSTWVDGDDTFNCGVLRDVSERKRIEQQVIRQERLRALGEMASGVAHDFNNTLSAVVGFSSLLLMRSALLDDRVKLTRYLETIHTAGQDALQLVQRLREFYRRRDEVEFLPVDVNEVVTMAVSLTAPRWGAQAQASGLTIRVTTALGDVPPTLGNAAELRDVLTNLIFNAVDAMPTGGTLSLATGWDEASDAVWIDVRDTGLGMTEEVRRRCLEPFFTTKGDRGTGLGLAMAYGIVQRHEGSIEIDSAPGRGTAFRIRLPRRTEGEGADQPVALLPPGRPLKVLVVEDEPIPLEVIVECLTGDGHTVKTATTGREGLSAFQADRFDVVITDRAMPEMNGLDLAVAIKGLTPWKPVIMLTGFLDDTEADAKKPDGIDYVVGKPVTLASLRRALAAVR